MKQDNFLKVIGKDYQYVTDGVYQFPAVVVNTMAEVHAWYDLYHAGMKTVDGFDVYVALAGNGRYFKTDGGDGCVQVFVHDKRDNICYLYSCLVCSSLKEAKGHIRHYKSQLKAITAGELLEVKKREVEGYPWRTFIVSKSKVMSYSDYKKSMEPVNMAEMLNS